MAQPSRWRTRRTPYTMVMFLTLRQIAGGATIAAVVVSGLAPVR
jgi:hypothetical protein